MTDDLQVTIEITDKPGSPPLHPAARTVRIDLALPTGEGTEGFSLEDAGGPERLAALVARATMNAHDALEVDPDGLKGAVEALEAEVAALAADLVREDEALQARVRELGRILGERIDGLHDRDRTLLREIERAQHEVRDLDATVDVAHRRLDVMGAPVGEQALRAAEEQQRGIQEVMQPLEQERRAGWRRVKVEHGKLAENVPGVGLKGQVLLYPEPRAVLCVRPAIFGHMDSRWFTASEWKALGDG